MSLIEFAEDLEESGGIKNTTVKDEQLFVKYFANPSNYSTKRGEIRDMYPDIKQVDRQEDSSGHVTLIYESQ